jgi:hypothetical protein
MSKMASHEPFGHLQYKLWQKEGSRVKLPIWLPTTKSRESTWPRCVQVECDTPLESSQGELEVFFRPHPNQRSEQRVMNSQSPESPNWDSFGTPPWESRDKKPFRCRCRGVTLTRSQVTGVKPQVRVSQSQVAELKLGSTLPTPNSRKG